MSAITRAIEIAGGLSSLAAKVEESPQTVSNWRARGRVPPKHCAAIERATNGEVTKADLCPEVFGTQEHRA